ncbi:hypothetical protein IPA_06765 [Ignicoccus pacificus DSM 13166]|uniref:Uncharacterized protein n=1 Tax=Ignicoccus pacificus DSM 13166 TaxID=940294 RepID=A0A977PLR7_9CREN|nr:hypothetical protein IPA_06745 [Ignicoccus pacificus DSM 13166]UXD22623.1 hypothetical protein IPA_06765 [Ignicoccus pacificus DSM 13166]
MKHHVIKGIKKRDSIEGAIGYVIRSMMKFNVSFSNVIYLLSPMLIIEAIAYARNFIFNELGINHRTYNKYEGSIMSMINSIINGTV